MTGAGFRPPGDLQSAKLTGFAPDETVPTLPHDALHARKSTHKHKHAHTHTYTHARTHTHHTHTRTHEDR